MDQEIIGPGGQVIRSIQNETGAEITIDEEDGVGVVTIAAKTGKSAEAAIERIKQIVAVPEVGEVYEGIIKRLEGFGAFVEIMPGKTGLLHVSEVSHDYVDGIRDHFSVGDRVKVKLLELKGDGKMRLSRKPLLDKPESTEDSED